MFLGRKSPFEKGAAQNPKSRYFKPFEFFDQTSLGSPLLGSHRLRVGVQSDTDRRMPHQFLHDLELRTGRPEERGVGSPKSMPPNSFRDPQV